MATLFNNWLLKEVVNKMIKNLKLLLNTCSIYIIISLKPKSMHDHSREGEVEREKTFKKSERSDNKLL